MNEYKSNQQPDSATTEYNALDFVINSLINKRHFCCPVIVTKVSNNDELAPVGYADLRPAIEQRDGFGNLVEHDIIYNCPYFRLQGGTNAIIIDPKIGDIGIALFADQDISIFQRIKKICLPGSYRRNDYSDGIYIGGILNSTPVQYIRYSAAGIDVISPTAVNIRAPQINSVGDWRHTGKITATDEITAIGTKLHIHTHGGVQTGGGNTSMPN